jgi:transcriptional regulator with XRE-family HTH domain
MSLLERGKRVPTLTTLTRLATALNILPSEIVRRVETRMGLTVKEKN